MFLLVNLINLAYTIFSWLLFGRIIISWVRPQIRDPRIYKLIRLLYDLTEPVLEPVRRFMPTGLGLDFSPIVALLLLGLIKGLLIDILL